MIGTEQLNQIMLWAERSNHDPNKILDMWNYDKARTWRTYLAMDAMERTGRTMTIDEFLSNAVEDTSNVDPDFEGIPQIEKIIKSPGMEDLKVLRKFTNGMSHKVSYNKTDNALWVMVTITSDFSTHTEEEHLMFELVPNPSKDEGIQNALDACISELKYRYLVNL